MFSEEITIMTLVKIGIVCYLLGYLNCFIIAYISDDKSREEDEIIPYSVINKNYYKD